VIGLFWTMHHRHFNWVRRVTGRVVWLNLLYLLALATIPYATAVLAVHPGRTGTILYASTLAVVSCISALVGAQSRPRHRSARAGPPRNAGRHGHVAGRCRRIRELDRDRDDRHDPG
jgi:uncharacterized membrane protein